MDNGQLGFNLDPSPDQIEHLAIPDAALLLQHDFLSKPQADTYLNLILEDTPWRQDYLRFAGKKVLIPRLQAWVGDSSSEYGYSGLPLSPLPWTETLLKLKELVEKEAQTNFNSVLLNYYRNGMDSVAWHSDDEKELGNDPIVASLSLGVSRRFELKHQHHKPTIKYSCLLEHGSLLVMGSGFQQNWLHQVPKEAEIILPRVNLTFRKIIL